MCGSCQRSMQHRAVAMVDAGSFCVVPVVVCMCPSLPLSVAAEVIWVQLDGGRHFILENPAWPESFHLACMNAKWNIGQCVKCNVPQCVLGLTIDGQPVYRNTISVAPSTLLLQFLKVCGARARRTAHWRDI